MVKERLQSKQDEKTKKVLAENLQVVSNTNTATKEQLLRKLRERCGENLKVNCFGAEVLQRENELMNRIKYQTTKKITIGIDQLKKM